MKNKINNFNLKDILFGKISTKLIAYFLLIGLIPLLIFGYLSITSIKEVIPKEISANLLSLAGAKEGQMVIYLELIKTRTIDFSSDGFIRDGLEEIENTRS